MIVVLDSNVWLSELGLRSPLGAVTRLFIRQHGARIALPEVIRLEVERHYRNRLREFIAKIQDNHRQLLTAFGTLKELVLPDA
jgi:predicted nucleic acid-binding protein